MLLHTGFVLVILAVGVSCVDLECGIVASQAQQLKRSAVSAKAEEVPWHVGIYSKKTTPYAHLCEGTLVSATAVITVAHCVWSRDSGAAQPAAELAVAAGKLRRRWDDPEDSHVQKSDVSKISIPSRFQGEVANFQDDIAVLKLASTIQFNSFVRPVCLDFDPDFDKIQLAPGKLGKIASWSTSVATSEPNAQEQSLQIQELPYVPIAQCFSEVPQYFRQFITVDKFCAIGKDTSQVLCAGSSGSGLAFPAEEHGVTRYYLRGVASVSAARDERCSQFVAFTHVAKHDHFITQNIL